MTTFYRLKEDGKILDYTEIDVIRDKEGNAINVPAFIKEQYIETERKIIKLVDGSFAFEDEVNIQGEERKRKEKEFNEAKKAKLNEVDAWTANKITRGMVSSCVGYPALYDTDRDTQYKLGLALNLVNAGVLQKEYPQGFPCRGYKQLVDGSFEADKTEHYFIAEAVIRWNAEFGEYLKKCTSDGWQKQAEVNACTTKEELEAIVLD